MNNKTIIENKMNKDEALYFLRKIKPCNSNEKKNIEKAIKNIELNY